MATATATVTATATAIGPPEGGRYMSNGDCDGPEI
jgi:hypothetical protein